MKFICQNCGKEYESYKENSKCCSKECKAALNKKTYCCDYCGKKIIISKRKYEDLIKGKQKHQYCSRECANKGQINSSVKECSFCHKPFVVYKTAFDTKKFCSKECYNKSRSIKEKLQKRICQMCGKEFFTYHKNQKFCSAECSNASTMKRQKCVCDTCGKEFVRKKSEVEKQDKHFCSFECRVNYNQWSDEDIQILRTSYRKIKTSEIQKMLSKSYSSKVINSKAIKIGIAKSRDWSEYETKILIENYPTKPMSEVLILLPERTLHSIIDKARTLNLQSWFYTTRIYSPQDIQYLKDNYLAKTDEQLAHDLNRDAYGIEQKLRNIGLYRPFEHKKDGYKNLELFMRAKIYMWKQNVREINNYTCCVTGKRSNIIVHHCRSFNLLFQETVDILNFEIKDDFFEYTDDELNLFSDTFLDLQEYYGEYVCVNETIHKLFHREYGYGDNTMEQWNEFVNNYKNGYYKEFT